MPHVLIVEALAQLSGAIGYFLGLNDAHVRSAALPRDVRSRAVACGRASLVSAWHRSHGHGRAGRRPSHRAGELTSVSDRWSRRTGNLASPTFAASVHRSWRAGAATVDMRPGARHFPPCLERPGVGA